MKVQTLTCLFLCTNLYACMGEMIRVIEPAEILVYGGGVEYDYKGIKVVYYGNHVTDKLKMTKGRIYVEVGGGDLLRIISFDKTNKRNHVIEREKNPDEWHVHNGYFHAKHGKDQHGRLTMQIKIYICQ